MPESIGAPQTTAKEEYKTVSLSKAAYNRIDEIGEEIHLLEEKLSITLSPHTKEKSPGDESKDKIQESDIVEIGHRINDRLDDVIYSLRSLRNRVDL